MTVIKQYCDHCGKELNDSADLTKADYLDMEIDLGSGAFVTTDLCISCFCNLKSFIYQYCKKEIRLQ